MSFSDKKITPLETALIQELKIDNVYLSEWRSFKSFHYLALVPDHPEKSTNFWITTSLDPPNCENDLKSAAFLKFSPYSDGWSPNCCTCKMVMERDLSQALMVTNLSDYRDRYFTLYSSTNHLVLAFLPQEVKECALPTKLHLCDVFLVDKTKQLLYAWNSFTERFEESPMQLARKIPEDDFFKMPQKSQP